MKMNNVVVKEGYELLAIVSCGPNEYHAIIKRDTKFQPYVFCYMYDISDGTWGNGYYCETYQGAIDQLVSHL